MEANMTTEEVQEDYEHINPTLKLLLVLPDHANLILLLFAVYGMYQGIEIRHPLYSVLFMNLIGKGLILRISSSEGLDRVILRLS